MQFANSTPVSVVHVRMRDRHFGKEYQSTLDATCAMTCGSQTWELRGREAQREALESWIECRGNDQHRRPGWSIDLELIDWAVVINGRGVFSG